MDMDLPASKTNMNYSKDYIIFDIETTGFSGKTDKVTEIAAIKYIDGKKIAEFNVLFNWNIPIPAKITELTTIDKALLDAEGIDPDKAIIAFGEFLGQNPTIIGHNILRFDIPFLRGNFPGFIWGIYNFFDTAALYKMKLLGIEFATDEKNHHQVMETILNQRHSIKYSLDTACTQFGIDKSKITRHRAMGDCQLTQKLYEILSK